jgi:protein-disulfide isomerase
MPQTIREHPLGSPAAPVTIVEYADFQCPFCVRFALGGEKDIIREYVDTGQVQLVFRQFPFIGDESSLAAEASECAADQDRFWEYHDLLFEKHEGENVGTYRPDNLKSYAEEVGLDPEGFATCLDSGQHRAAVEVAKTIGAAQGVRSTPTFFIDGQKFEGAPAFEEFSQIIEAALQG